MSTYDDHKKEEKRQRILKVKELAQKLGSHKESVFRAYHFSYDITGWEDNFGTYDEAKIFLRCIIAQTPFIQIRPVNNSSLIIYYNSVQPKLFNYLEKHLEKCANFTISLVALDDNTKKSVIHINKDEDYFSSQILEWNEVKCSNETLKKITPY